MNKIILTLSLLMGQSAWAVCASYSQLPGTTVTSITDALVEGYLEEFSGYLRVRFASGTTNVGNFTCMEVYSTLSHPTTGAALSSTDAEAVRDRIRRAAILSMTLGYKFSGVPFYQTGYKLYSAGVTKP